MPHLATAFADPSPVARRPPPLSDTLAAIAAAGATIADLRQRLARAERTIAVLETEKRAARAELRALRHGVRQLSAPEAAPANRSHLDDALAALVEGLGPDIVRRGP